MPLTLRRILAVGLTLVGVVYLARIVHFVATPGEPVAYYKDLGFNWEIIEWARCMLVSPSDFRDALGWSPWFSGPLYYLSSYLGDLPAFIVAKMVGNSWLAIKIVEAIQVVCSFVGAVAFYRTATARSGAFSLAFGLIIAVAPEAALTIRWNQDFGWIIALLPWALLANDQLLARFGSRALPAVGLLSGLCGYVIALQFFAFVSLPLFAITVAARCKLRPAIVTPLLIGVTTMVASGLFYVLPTFMHPLYTDSLIRSNSLANASFLGEFSENWLDVAALVEREWHASPVPEFNIAPSLPLLAWVGIPQILTGLIYLIFVHRTGSRDRYASFGVATIVLILVVLALGSSIAFGEALWRILYLLPHINGIRSTDRFMALPLFFVSYWFIQGAELASHRKTALAAPACALVLTVMAAWLAVDFETGCFSVDPSIGMREPGLAEVRAAVTKSNERAVSFVGVNGGASEDSPTYGRPAPFDAYVDTDLAGRYLLDGLGGIGVFSRVGIGSIVSGPNWLYDRPYWPATSNIYRTQPLARTVLSLSEDVYVSRIAASPLVASVSALCVRGGPGAFDLLDVLPVLSDTAFAPDQSHCPGGTGLIDFDPLDAVPDDLLISRIAGSALFPQAKHLQDRDYRLDLNRTLLNIPWYRNSIDGDRPSFDAAGAVTIEDGNTSVIRAPARLQRNAVIAFRVATRSEMKVSVSDNVGILGAVSASPAQGFRWLSIRVPRDVAVGMPLKVQFTATPAEALNGSTWTGIALDGINIVKESQDRTSITGPVRFASIALGRAAVSSTPVFHRFVIGPLVQSPLRQHGFMTSMLGGRKVLLPTQSSASTTFPWTAPNGNYVLEIKSVLFNPGSLLQIETPTGRSAVSKDFDGPLILQTHLRHGDPVTIRYYNAYFDRSLGERIEDVSAVAVAPPEAQLDDEGRISRRYALTDAATSLATIASSTNVLPTSTGLRGIKGSRVSFRFPVPAETIALTLRADVTASGLTRAVNCGHGSTRSEVFAGINDAPLTLMAPRICTVGFEWHDSQAVLAGFDAIFTTTIAPSRKLYTWVPAGRFRKILLRADGRASPALGISWPDCSAGETICTIAVARRLPVKLGVHVPQDGQLVLVPDGKVQPAPAIGVVRQSSTAWSIVIGKRTSLRVAELNDDNWLLTTSNGSATIGASCDIAATCFEDVPRGQYSLHHRYDWALVIGMGATLLATGAAFSYLPLSFWSRRKSSLPPIPARV